MAPGAAAAVAATGSSVFTWGSNSFGQLGDGSSTGTVRGTPALVSLADVIDISGGREHALALRSDGTVEAWGSDQNGAIGNGLPLSNVSTPVAVPGLTDIVDVDDGHYHSLALRSDGTVWGWGQNFLGQLAQGNDASPKAAPVQWGSISDAVAVYGGRDMTYVLDADGTLWCSGGNGLECGRADGPAEITDPVTVPGLPDLLPGPGPVEVAGGRNHAVALAPDGTVWTWGENDYGQLASGDRTNRATPQQVAGLTDVVEVGAGAEHSLAVTAAGDVYVWGAGSRGELGLGTRTDRLTPVKVPTLSGIVEVDAGRSHSFAIGGDGRLWAWGWNDGKQVNSSSSDVLSPYQVPGLTDVVAAGGGQAFSVALTKPVDAILSDGFDEGLTAWTVTGRLRLDDLRKSPVGTAPSVRASVTQRKAGAWRSLPDAQYHVCLGAWVRRDTVGKTTTLLRLRDAAGIGVAQLQVTPNGSLRASSEIDAVSADVGASLPAGTWRRVEICSRHDQGASDSVSVRVGGVEVGSWPWTTAQVSQVQIGSLRKTTVTMNLDDVVVS